jgi:4-hydroxy-tetrahydrodipicolinate reductase
MEITTTFAAVFKGLTKNVFFQPGLCKKSIMATTKVGLLGYGKMGRMIASLAPSQQVEIIWKVDRDDRHRLSPTLLQEADVIIEFSSPSAGFPNVKMCLEAGVPVISGTTGWQEHLPEAKAICQMENGAFLWASNFSVGVNLFFALNARLAQMMAHWPQYQPVITEIHHTHKLDAPSGTAVTMAEGILENNALYEKWHLGEACSAQEIPIASIREGEVPGTHIIQWASPVDEIILEHKAHSREGFAMGALIAAKWIVGKKGVFNMGDVMGI